MSLPGPILLREGVLDIEVTAVEFQGSKPPVVQGHRLLHVGDALTYSRDGRMGPDVPVKGWLQLCRAPLPAYRCSRASCRSRAQSSLLELTRQAEARWGRGCVSRTMADISVFMFPDAKVLVFLPVFYERVFRMHKLF